MSDEITVTVKRVIPTPSGCGIFLTNGYKVIAIFVDHAVGAAISMYMHDIKRPRPLTHDLMAHLMTGLGVTIRKVLINDLRDDTFYARIYFRQENELGKKLVEVDARPSDAMAMAIQQGCPIAVGRTVWEAAEDMTWAIDQADESQDS